MLFFIRNTPIRGAYQEFWKCLSAVTFDSNKFIARNNHRTTACLKVSSKRFFRKVIQSSWKPNLKGQIPLVLMIRTGKKECRHPGKTKREGVSIQRCFVILLSHRRGLALGNAFPQVVEVSLSVRLGWKGLIYPWLKTGWSMLWTHLTKGVAGSLVDLLDGTKIRQENDVS